MAVASTLLITPCRSGFRTRMSEAARHRRVAGRVRWWLLAGLVVVLGGLGGWGYLQRVPSRATQAFRVGFQSSPPQQIVTADLKPTGPAIEVFAAAAYRAGIPIEWVHSPEGPDVALRNGHVDLWPLITDRPERREYLHISAPWTMNTYWLLALKQKG